MTVTELEVSRSKGWYRDPWGRHEYRWWDGSEWTDRVNTRDAVLQEALDAKASPSNVARRRTVLSVLVLAVVVLGGLAAYFVFVDDSADQTADDVTEVRAVPLVGEAAAPFTLRTCPASEAGGCPVEVTLEQIECGIGSLPDVEGPVDQNYNPTETIAPDAGEFCAVEYRIENKGSQELSTVAAHLELVDADGNTTVEADDSSPRVASARVRYGIRQGERLAPGASTSHVAVFDVAEGAEPAQIVFTGGLGVEEKTVELGAGAS